MDYCVTPPARAHTPSTPRTLAASPSPFGYVNSSHTDFKRNSVTTWTTHQKSVKYGKGKYFDVELIPQPSDDSDDPLVRLTPIISHTIR